MSNVVPPDTAIAHGLRRADLETGGPEVTALRRRGRWPVEDLWEDEFVDRRRPYQLAALKLVRAADNEIT